MRGVKAVAIDATELRFMNSPLKVLMQRYFEFPIFKRFLSSCSVDLSNKAILEVGCGSGYGLELLYKEFRPSKLVAFDILPDQVALARSRRLPAKVFIGSVLDISLPSDTFDAVFIFTVFHHVEGWRDAFKELNRILKPNGVLLVNELSKRSLDRIERFLKVKHPKMSRFSWKEFREGLISTGFRIVREKMILKDFGFFMCIKVPF
ncbi:MAG: class I SAM-dependent methyltransferase [Candidatus Hodarchaeota archaeon]